MLRRFCILTHPHAKPASVTRELTETLVKSLATANRDAKILTRDVSQGLPFIDETWVGATFTDPAERTPEQRLKLAVSRYACFRAEGGGRGCHWYTDLQFFGACSFESLD